MNWLMDILRGAAIGIANIIPGVSGGTMAVSMGIYNRLIYAINDLFRNFRKTVADLLPLIIGMAMGIVGFTYAVEYLLHHYALPTCMTFIGLIFGGIPVLWRNFQHDKKNTTQRNLLYAGIFILMFGVSGIMPLLNGAVDTGNASMSLLTWFLIGLIASVTMIIPGVSGSMVLMIMGYYYTLISRLKAFFEALRAWDLALAVELAIPLFFFGIGVLLGIFLIAKLIRWLFEQVPAVTYSAILGLVISSPIAMLYNTGALYDLQKPSGMIQLVIGAVLLCLAFIAVYLPDRKSDCTQRKPKRA